MQEISLQQAGLVSGAGISEAIDEFVYDVGYGIGYAAGYFYNNVMIGNGIVDDIANTLGE